MIQRIPFLSSKWLNFVALAMLILTLLLVNSNLFAFERKVLFEEFTASTCGSCANLAPQVHNALVEASDIVAVVAYHVWWPAPGNDPWVVDNREDAQIRVNYYGVNATPTFFTDGEFTGRSGGAILRAIENRAEEASPLSIDLRGYIVDGVIRVSVTVTSEEDLEEELEDLTLQVVLKEIYYRYNGRAGQNDYYNPMIKMTPDADGTDFDIGADEVQHFTLTQSMEDLGWHDLEIDNLALVAWVQSNDHEVYQAQERNLEIVSPYLEVTNSEIYEGENGDGDGRPEIGEIGELVVTLANHEDYLDAESIEIRLSTFDNTIRIENGLSELDGVAGGESIDNSESPFLFEVEEGYEPHPVTFTITVNAQPGDFEVTEQITAMIGWPSTLLVDASENEDAGDAMLEYFGSEQLPTVDRWDRAIDGDVTEGILENYEIVLWHSFNHEENIMTESEEDLLMSYLDSGGTLIVSSPFFALTNGNGRL